MTIGAESIRRTGARILAVSIGAPPGPDCLTSRGAFRSPTWRQEPLDR